MIRREQARFREIGITDISKGVERRISTPETTGCSAVITNWREPNHRTYLKQFDILRILNMSMKMA